jgi:hypothetical protein
MSWVVSGENFSDQVDPLERASDHWASDQWPRFDLLSDIPRGLYLLGFPTDPHVSPIIPF